MKSIYEFLLKSKTSISAQDAEYVDLGLPSGLLWAKCNIGAYEPYEYGDYFMWGSTSADPDKKCGWTNCPFNKGSSVFCSGYFKSIQNDVCPNNILTSEYDAVTAILGDGWRLPTNDDFWELINNTEHEWIKNYKGSKINGMRFTPKNVKVAKANSDENYDELFIPVSGYRYLSNFYYRGSYAYLWSSTLDAHVPDYASILYFDDFHCYTSNCSRCYALCIRGVKNK